MERQLNPLYQGCKSCSVRWHSNLFDSYCWCCGYLFTPLEAIAMQVELDQHGEMV